LRKANAYQAGKTAGGKTAGGDLASGEIAAAPTSSRWQRLRLRAGDLLIAAGLRLQGRYESPAYRTGC
jgi:hypothetical protein